MVLLFFFYICCQYKQNFCNHKKEHFCVTTEIDKLNFFFKILCDECLKFKSLCTIIFDPNELDSLKYFECLHLNYFCSFCSWLLLD